MNEEVRIETGACDDLSMYGEQIVRPDVPRKRAYVWPKPWGSLNDIHDSETLVAKTDGVVAGRAILEAVYQPVAELVNMEVSEAHRGKGLGSRLVAEASRRAAEKGFLALHVQTELDNTPAQALYVKSGFFPATTGEMLRMVKFLSYPALEVFLARHPTALLSSRAERNQWRLEWRDHVSDDLLSLGISGGSCQSDSDGRAPGVASFEWREGTRRLVAAIDAPPEVSVGKPAPISLNLRNEGAGPLEVRARLLLSEGWEPAEGAGARELSVPVDEAAVVSFPALMTSGFDVEPLAKVCSYPSAPVAAELVIDSRVFWLCARTVPA